MGVSRIFLSHSHQDNDWCSAFVEELKRYGLDIWFDKQSLYVGAKWLQTIETELEGRDAFLVVLTPASWSSAWVRDELALALAQHKLIVSVLHQPTQVSGFITMYQMLNVIGLSSVEAAKAVAAALGLSRVEQSPVLTPSLKPSASTVIQSADEQHEYFEIALSRTDFGPIYQIINTNGGNVPSPNLWAPVVGSAEEFGSSNQKYINELRTTAKNNGLEELPEKGRYWYSYRFRRKKK